MLYYLFEYLAEHNDFWGKNLYRFLSFRAAAAMILSLMISFFFGKMIIERLQKLQIGEVVRDLGLEGQLQKQGTPTMGGIIIILSIMVPTVLLAKVGNVYIVLMLFATIWLGLIGFLDDYIKVFKKDKEGLKGKFKILGQIILGLVVGIVMLSNDAINLELKESVANEFQYEILDDYKKTVRTLNGETSTYVVAKSTLTNVPFLKNRELDYAKLLWFLEYEQAKKYVWIVFIPIVIFIITAVSNAANLTDGLDGLATGTSAITGITLGVLAYVSGNFIAADYLDIIYQPHIGELVIFAAALIGACIGFLWYNSYPAQVFMGDTGSLVLGGVIATMAILIRKELLIPILCGIFVMENLSVVMQVSYFKYTKKKYGEGKRIFLMSPLHHHYQKKGIPEAKIVTRFWIVGILLAVVTLLTLKIR